MVNLKTPLVITTVLIVLGMGVVRLVLVPEEWLSSLIALAFLPLAIGGLIFTSRSVSDPARTRKLSGRLRAALVGAGVLLATAMLLSITDKLGITVQDAESDMRSLAVLLPAIIATAADLLSARLEHQAEQDSDEN